MRESGQGGEEKKKVRKRDKQVTPQESRVNNEFLSFQNN